MFSVNPDQICTGTCSVQQKSELVPELAIETYVSKLLFLLISSLGAPFLHSCQGLEQKVPCFSTQPIYCPRLSWYVFDQRKLSCLRFPYTFLDTFYLLHVREKTRFSPQKIFLDQSLCHLLNHSPGASALSRRNTRGSIH